MKAVILIGVSTILFIIIMLPWVEGSYSQKDQEVQIDCETAFLATFIHNDNRIFSGDIICTIKNGSFFNYKNWKEALNKSSSRTAFICPNESMFRSELKDVDKNGLEVKIEFERTCLNKE